MTFKTFKAVDFREAAAYQGKAESGGLSLVPGACDVTVSTLHEDNSANLSLFQFFFLDSQYPVWSLRPAAVRLTVEQHDARRERGLVYF